MSRAGGTTIPELPSGPATLAARAAAAALIVSGPAGIAGHWMHPGGHDTLANPQHPLWVPAHGLLFLSYLLTLLALPAVYGRVAPRVGVFGLGAFVMTCLGLAHGVMVMNTEVFIVRPLAMGAGSADAALKLLHGSLAEPLPWVGTLFWWCGTLGALLFGAALLRVGRDWRAAAVPLMLGAPLFILLDMAGNGRLGFLTGFSLLHAGFAIAGALLWRAPGTPSSTPVPAGAGSTPGALAAPA
ncbi:MAG TPA: hypothetical protein VF710_19705 [Longimicrobium sp.]|jgi:hypothetical protein